MDNDNRSPLLIGAHSRDVPSLLEGLTMSDGSWGGAGLSALLRRDPAPGFSTSPRDFGPKHLVRLIENNPQNDTPLTRHLAY